MNLRLGVTAEDTPSEDRATPPGAETCTLCTDVGGDLVWKTDDWRVIRASDSEFPATYRLVAREHVAEFSDLDNNARAACVDYLVAVESAMRSTISPTKVNLASLGNQVPHLHWHIVGRFTWDSRFPAAVWAPRERVVDPLDLSDLRARLALTDATVAEALAQASAMRSAVERFERPQ